MPASDEQNEPKRLGFPSKFSGRRGERSDRNGKSQEHFDGARLVRRTGMLVFTLVAFCACLMLGLWQWRRFHEAGGTFQNLGYALQWPLFAVFVIYGYVRFFGLLKDTSEGRDVTAKQQASSAMPPLPEPASPAELVGPRHKGRAAYNAMLAELAERTATSERNSP